jgi:hypothetical protein
MMVHDADTYFRTLDTLQLELLTALDEAEPDLTKCQQLTADITQHLAQLMTFTEPFAHEHALVAATQARALLQRCHERVLALREQRQHEQRRSERDHVAAKNYAQLPPPETPRFLDERR